MALTFPASPSNGDTHLQFGVNYIYNATEDLWKSAGVPDDLPGNVITPKAADPTTRDNGTALEEGDLYYNTADDAIKTYDGSAWNAVGGSDTTASGVGTYTAAGSRITSGAGPGGTVAGSSLVISGNSPGPFTDVLQSNENSYSQPGTWRRMANQKGETSSNTGEAIFSSTLWVRIS